MEGLNEACDALKRSLLVYGLDHEQTEAIGAIGKKVCFTAGEHLTQMGARESDLFVIMDGHVNLLTEDSDKLAEVGPGGILGEISFVDAGPRHCYAVATGFTTALQFPAKELRAHLCHHKDAGFLVVTNLARLLAARLRSADTKLDHLMNIEHDTWKNAL